MMNTVFYGVVEEEKERNLERQEVYPVAIEINGYTIIIPEPEMVKVWYTHLGKI